MKKRKSIFNSTYRCIYCNHKGEWITIYVRCETFTKAFQYVQKELIDMWIIKEISERLENGELVGKDVIEP